MTLTLMRQPATDDTILGRLAINGVFECFTLEGADVAIPCGTYPVVITYSHRFQRMLPLVQNVAGRSGIRIHPGNTEADTEGCILVGASKVGASVMHSRAAMELLQPKLAMALASGDRVQLTIEEAGAGQAA